MSKLDETWKITGWNAGFDIQVSHTLITFCYDGGTPRIKVFKGSGLGIRGIKFSSCFSHFLCHRAQISFSLWTFISFKAILTLTLFSSRHPSTDKHVQERGIKTETIAKKMAILMAMAPGNLGLLQSLSGFHLSQPGLEEEGREGVRLQTLNTSAR